jgi:SsrA-binding protein
MSLHTWQLHSLVLAPVGKKRLPALFRNPVPQTGPRISRAVFRDKIKPALTMPRQSTHQTKPSPEKSPRRDPTASGERDAAVNRIASHNYFLLEKFECGVVLTGTEAKSVRGGLANLKDSYGLVKDGELWLLNAHIGPYEHGNIHNHAPLRTRKLLMHKEEIRKLIGKTQQKGLTLIPVRMYFKNGKVKVELALAKGKQLWDKRETERRRTADKEAREAITRSRRT